MINGIWLAYLEKIDTRAKEMLDTLIKDMAVNQGINEDMKSKDPFALFAIMEPIKHTAEEFVFTDLIL